MVNPAGQDSSGGNVVTVGEATRHAENLKANRGLRAFQQSIDMNRFRPATGSLKRKRRFLIAVGSRSSKN